MQLSSTKSTSPTPTFLFPKTLFSSTTTAFISLGKALGEILKATKSTNKYCQIVGAIVPNLAEIFQQNKANEVQSIQARKLNLTDQWEQSKRDTDRTRIESLKNFLQQLNQLIFSS